MSFSHNQNMQNLILSFQLLAVCKWNLHITYIFLADCIWKSQTRCGSYNFDVLNKNRKLFLMYQMKISIVLAFLSRSGLVKLLSKTRKYVIREVIWTKIKITLDKHNENSLQKNIWTLTNICIPIDILAMKDANWFIVWLGLTCLTA